MPPTKKKLLGVAVEDLEIEIGIEEAIEIVGFRAAGEGEDGVSYETATGKGRFVLDRNGTNRPFSISLAKQYATQMLRGEWAGQTRSGSKTCNGETFVVDGTKNVVSCAHRCVALILAENQRQRLMAFGRDDLIEEYGCEKPITLKAIIVTGVDSVAADTNDLGRGRNFSDVLFRRREFSNGKELTTAAVARLSKELAVAVRLVWLRTNGYEVKGAPKLFHPEGLAFLQQHPLLHDAVLFVYEKNGGFGVSGKKISDYVSLGYAAALLYLAAYKSSNAAKYHDGNLSMGRKPPAWKAAEAFWEKFAEEKFEDENDARIKDLHKVLEKNARSENKYPRDAVCTLIVRGYLAWTGEVENWGSVRAMISKLFTKVDDREVLNFERLGGLDLDRLVLEEMGAVKNTKLERQSVVSFSEVWKKNDTVWIKQPDVDLWFGKIVKFGSDGEDCVVLPIDDPTFDGELEGYTCKMAWLCAEEPKQVIEEEVGGALVASVSQKAEA